LITEASADASSVQHRTRGGIPGRLVKGCVLFGLGLGAAAVAAYAASFVPESPQPFEARMAWLAENPERYDTIFIGSSRILHSMPVETFDEALRAQGINAGPSFNMGIQGAAMHQNFFTIRKLLDAGVRPRFLAVECSPFTSYVPHAGLKRIEHWHDWSETLRVLDTTLEEKEVEVPFRDPSVGSWTYSRPVRAWVHLLYMIRRYLPVSRVHDFSLESVLTDGQRAEIERTRGYLRYDKDKAGDHAAGNVYFDYPELWDRRIAALASAYDGQYPDPVNLKAVVDLARYTRDRNVKLVFIGTPYSEIGWVEPYLKLSQSGIISMHGGRTGPPLFLNFNLPHLPYVYDPSLRYDEQHTNNQGSELFARDLAMAWTQCFPELSRP
jgi:hypothetical protein